MFVKPRGGPPMFFLNVEIDTEFLQRLPCEDRSCCNENSYQFAR